MPSMRNPEHPADKIPSWFVEWRDKLLKLLPKDGELTLTAAEWVGTIMGGEQQEFHLEVSVANGRDGQAKITLASYGILSSGTSPAFDLLPDLEWARLPEGSQPYKQPGLVTVQAPR